MKEEGYIWNLAKIQILFFINVLFFHDNHLFLRIFMRDLLGCYINSFVLPFFLMKRTFVQK
jgi:hypothetical protein